MSAACVCVFAKAPIEGQVKTRLFPVLTPQQACSVHKNLLQHCVSNVQGADWQNQLWTTDIQHPFITQCADQYPMSVHLQQGIDLGERMAHAVKTSLKNFSYVIIIGSDCPSIDTQLISKAVSALKAGSDVVIAPAKDGGYALIALSKLVPSIFKNMPWGSDQVLALTRERLLQAGARCHELAEQRDIDRPDDLDYLQQHYPALLTQ